MVLGNRTLRRGDLLAILGEIYRKQETGTLVMQQGTTSKFLYAQEGQFIFAASNAVEDKFTEILIEKGKLTREQLVIAQEKKDGRTIGRTLVEMGFLTSGDLLDALLDQIKRIASSVAAWESGRSVFKTGILPKNVAKLPISTPWFILDTALGIDAREWTASTLGGLEAPIVMSKAEREAVKTLSLASQEVRVVESIDNKRNSRRICEVAKVDTFDGARFLIGLSTLGLCRVDRKSVV